MSYEDKSPEEVVADFVQVRGDLIEERGRSSMLAVLKGKFMSPILVLHREVSDPGRGIKRCDQSCREPVTGAIYEFPCPTYRAAAE